MRHIRRFFERVVDLSAVIGMFSIAAMMFHITIDVICRALGYPLVGTVTIVSHYYMVMAAFASLALAERQQAHIGVEVFTELMPQRAQYHLASWLYIVSVLVFGHLAYRTFFNAVDKYQIGSFQIEGDMAILLWPSYAVLPVGFGLMMIAVAFRFIDYLTGRGDGQRNPDPATPTAD